VGHARDHPLIAAHATRRRPALRFSEVVKPGVLIRDELYGDLLHAADVDYEIAIDVRSGRGKTVVAGLGRTERGFSERDRDVLDIARPGLERALRATQARGRLIRALADDPPPGTAVLLLDRDTRPARPHGHPPRHPWTDRQLAGRTRAPHARRLRHAAPPRPCHPTHHHHRRPRQATRRLGARRHHPRPGPSDRVTRTARSAGQSHTCRRDRIWLGDATWRATVFRRGSLALGAARSGFGTES
jgi:hypothetical protein